VRRNAVPDGGFVLIYSDITERKRSEAEIRAARDAAEGAYRDLKAAQASLIQAEKMASLGQLTAGIAHEIKNPLNFVNNFADLSVELLDESLGESARSASILVVDDEPDVADLFRQSFREARQGTYVMLFAVSGAEALNRLAKEIEPTLIAVLSDINMPGMDGLELLAEIRQRSPDLPVMMVTAMATTSEDAAPANSGLLSSSPSLSISIS
jgi:CheY-like chemotaxis protein